MEEHYIKDVGKITYTYGVDLEEHTKVIEKQQKRIAELEKQLDQPQTQLAIQELEKVKINLKDKITMMSNEEHCYQRKVVCWFDICDQVNQQIKEVRGEKDE